MVLLRQSVKLFLLAISIAIAACLQPLVLLFNIKGRNRHIICRLWHRAVLRIMAIHLHVTGQPAAGPSILLANHVSNLDIPVLGSIVPLRFISKQEVKQWPVFGFLAGLQESIFIDRAPTLAAVKKARAAIQDAVVDRHTLVIFPEGTNTIGDKVLPFRRGLLDGLNAPGYQLQPVAIKCTAVDGKMPHTQEDFEVYGWGDISFVAHFWQVMAHKRLDVAVHFFPPYTVDESGKIKGAIVEQSGDLIRRFVVEGNNA